MRYLIIVILLALFLGGCVCRKGVPFCPAPLGEGDTGRSVPHFPMELKNADNPEEGFLRRALEIQPLSTTASFLPCNPS
jgi:hypothetical protein